MASFASPFTVFAATAAALPLFLTPATAFGPAHMDQVGDQIDSADTATVTATGLEKNDSKGTAYQIMTLNWDDAHHQPTEAQYEWADQVAQWVRDNYPQYIKGGASGTSNEVEVLDNFNDELADNGEVTSHEPVNNGAAEFYDKLSAAIKAGEINPRPASTAQTSENGTATFTNMKMGTWLVLFEGGQKTYRPSVAVVAPTFNKDQARWEFDQTVDLTVKSSPASIDKEADVEQQGINERVNFTVTADVPVYPENAANKTYIVTDDLPKSLTLDASTVKVVDFTGDQDGDVLVKDTDYTAEYTPAAGDKNDKLVLTFNQNEMKSVEKIKVTYTAQVNQNAVVSPPASPDTDTVMTNTATVTYPNDPYVDGTVNQTDKETFYVYGLDLNKVDEKNTSKTLPGATFTVKPKGGADIKFVKVSDGVYRVATANEQNQVTEIANATNGNLKVQGLKPGTYEVKEVVAPKGYVQLQAPLEITITDANDDGIVDENALPGDQGYVTWQIKNVEGFALPVTGAQGITLLVIGAAVLISAGAVVLVRTRRKADQDA